MTPSRDASAPGTRLVVDQLGDYPTQLLTRHPRMSEPWLLALLIHQAAYHLDLIQNSLVHAARRAGDDLLRIVRGTDYTDRLANDGYLRTAGAQIEILSARRADALAHLYALLAVYQGRDPTNAPSAAPEPAVQPVRTAGAPTPPAAGTRNR